jgi:Transposase DDE domain
VEPFDFDESWQIIRQVFPPDLETIARQSGSFRRARTVGSAETLLRLLLMHASGLSLRQTALRAKERGLANLSAVALFKRLRQSEAFLQQLARGVLEQVPARAAPVKWPGGYRFRLIDATTVKEPGPTGSCWRIHYSLRLPELTCDHFELTDPESGESFKRWQAGPNEVLLADRAYAHREAVGALSDQGVKVVVRFNGRSFPLLTEQGRSFNVLARLRGLKVGEVKEWPLHFRVGDKCWPIRLCALRKSPLAAARAARKVHRKAQLRQQRFGPSRKALALSAYLLVLTNLDLNVWSGLQVLELYRCRWQVELAFKRLKGLLKLGHLPKNDPQSARAWLQLKLLLALVIEKLCYQARFFSPWGYRLEFQPLGGMAGNDRLGADEPALPPVAT